MKIILQDNLETINIDNNTFNIKLNKSIIHQVYISYLSNLRKNIKLNKNRSKVSGSNRKPWKQKGTGRSRAGSYKSPIWRSGGVTFGNQKRSFYKKINKKMYKLACKSLLSYLINKNKIFFFNEFKIPFIKTKLLYNKIYNICKTSKVLILLNKYDEFLVKSSQNIYSVSVKSIFNINLISILTFKYVILTKSVIKSIEILLS